MGRIKKYISCLLIIMLLGNCLQNFSPTQAIAATKEINIISNLDRNEKTDELAQSQEDVKEYKIVKEVEEKREENVKQFMKEDGSFEAVVYSTKVHYMDNGILKDIDNTLKSTTDENGNHILKNTANDLNVKFANNANSKELVTLQKDKFKLSWGLKGAQNINIKKEEKNQTHIDNKIEKETNKKIETENKYLNASDEEKAEAKSILIQNVKKETLDKVCSEVSYSDILKGTDLQYILEGNNLKENIILKEKIKNPVYSFCLNTNNLQGSIKEDRSITFYDKDDNSNAVFNLSAPYMYDANGAQSNAISVKLEPNNDGYTLVMEPDSVWINSSERVFPITLDPPVSSSKDYDKIQDTFIGSIYDDECGQWCDPCLRVGRSSEYGIMRSLIKFNLPTLNPGDKISYAHLNLNCEGVSGDNIQVSVHNVFDEWSEFVREWNDQPGYDTNVEDYITIKNNVISKGYFDITSLVNYWYNDPEVNFGLMLKTIDENSGYALFSSSERSESVMPSVTIYYVNNTGLENYWDYKSQDVGRAGTGYVNVNNGNLVFLHNDISMNGNLMPITITHIYNSNQACDKSASSNIGFGEGWRLNLSQKMEIQNIDNVIYYVYTDADGTKHYFKKEGVSPYKDELKLGYNLVVNEDGTYLLQIKKIINYFLIRMGNYHIWKIAIVIGKR